MQPVDRRIVDLFNEALTFELTVTNTYFLHARMLDNWGFTKLGKVFYDLSIDEMKDADEIINRILFFEGHPNVQKLNPITVGETAEEMLQLAHTSELAAVAQFNAAAKECHDLGLRVDFWTVNEPDEARRLLALGADGIMTDDPARVGPSVLA